MIFERRIGNNFLREGSCHYFQASGRTEGNHETQQSAQFLEVQD
jgi:hypothetical protein